MKPAPLPEVQGEWPSEPAGPGQPTYEAMQLQLVESQEEMVRYVNAWAKQQRQLVLQLCEDAQRRDLQAAQRREGVADGGKAAPPTNASDALPRPETAAGGQLEPPKHAAPSKPDRQRPEAKAEEDLDDVVADWGAAATMMRSVGSVEWIEANDSEGAGQEKRGIFWKIYSSKYFEVACLAVILLNAAYMAYRAERSVALAMAGEASEDATTLAVECTFAIVYTAEMVIRLRATRLQYFVGRDRKWNCFDALLVGLAWYDLAMQIWGGGVAGNLSYLRIMRLLKMIKLLRLVRVMKSLRELRLIVSSIMNSVRSMFWAVLLILMIAFMFGVCLVQGVTSYLEDKRNLVEVSELDYLIRRWGKISSAIYSLCVASMGGGDWEEIADSLWPVGPLFFFLFLAYIGFFLCVVTNTLTSLFVETAIADAERDQQAMVEAELQHKEKYVTMLEAWYAELEEDGSGDISLDEFMRHAEDEHMIAFCAQMEINITEVKQFFIVLSNHGRRPVTLDTFVVGCLKLKGTAKSMDLMDLSYSQKQSAADMRNLIESTSQEISAVDRKLDGLFALIAGATSHNAGQAHSLRPPWAAEHEDVDLCGI